MRILYQDQKHIDGRKRRKKNYIKHKEYDLKYQKDNVRKRKELVIEHYSHGTNKCMWEGCDVTDMDMLTLDHIDGNGAEHRKEIGYSGTLYYGWLIKNNYPDGYQVLCFNHQRKKQILNHEYIKREKQNCVEQEYQEIVFQ
jgi:hypothetical protein